MSNSENFAQIKKKIHLFFDNALDNSETENLLNKIDNDPKYSSNYIKEKDFRDFVKSNISRPTVSNDLIENIKNSIIQK